VGKKHSSGTHEAGAEFEDQVPIFFGLKNKYIKTFSTIKHSSRVLLNPILGNPF
jgi:hypothetical protein